MSSNNFLSLCAIAVTLATAIGAESPARGDDHPAYWEWAKTPPMGWNSYDAFGSSVTEEEFMANATYLKDHLLTHGYNLVVVDFRWSDANAANYNPNGIGGPLVADEFGRLLPAPNRFPSAVDRLGFKPLADLVHSMGLKFGIHVMRGIPRQSVTANTPIKGSSFRASDAADLKSSCGWCKDMWGVNASTQAGQDYYDSIFCLYASWGVDFVKVDDLSSPYHGKEIEAVRKAIDKCGRPIVFSTSPGETPVKQADHIVQHANMWRVSSDFWDNWKSLNHAFDLASVWEGKGGPGHWPDFDMIPFSRLSVGNRSVGGERLSRFSHDEQQTLFSLWALGPSPLMLGGDLRAMDEWTLSLLTNDRVIAVNQDPLGSGATRLEKNARTEVWGKKLADNSMAIGLFNRGDMAASVSIKWEKAGLAEKNNLTDLWLRKDIGSFADGFTTSVPPHGVVLIKAVQQ